jgi:hypothetical protein
MSCRSKKFDVRKKAFSLVEVAMAVMILDLVFLSVLVVIDRCVDSVAGSAMRMRAFEVARENMEKLLAFQVGLRKFQFASNEVRHLTKPSSISSSTMRITVGRLTSSRAAIVLRAIGLSRRMSSRMAERLISRMAEAVMVSR